MDIYKEFGLEDSMDKDAVLKKINAAERKLIHRQDSPEMNKRHAAERQLEVFSNSEITIKQAAANFPNVHLIVKTYAFASDNEILNNDFVVAMNDAVSGKGAASIKITDFLKDCRQDKQDGLIGQWMFWAAECGEARAYQICGSLLAESDPDKALEWFTKAADANSIDADNIYHWGLIFYKRKKYDEALPKLEQASAKGHGEAAYYAAVIYENGYTGSKNLQKALEMYRFADQKGAREARQAIKRIDDFQKALQEKAQSAPRNNTQQNVSQNNTQRTSYAANKNKRKRLTKKQIIIRVIAVWLLISILRSCAANILLKSKVENNDFDPFEMAVPGEENNIADQTAQTGIADTEDVIGDVDEAEEPEEVEEEHRDLTADEKELIGTYEGYYYTGGRKEGLTLTVYENNGLEASCKVYPLAGDSGIQAGEYLMDVVYSDEQYIFTATDWVEQPGGYNMIDLSGVLDGETLYGMTNLNTPFSATVAGDSNAVKETWLTDLAYLQADNDITIVEDRIGTANTGDNYMRYIYSRQPYSEIIYQLNGQYDILTAVWAISYNARDWDGTHSFEIYADDELVYTSETIQAGSLPGEVRADIKNCNLLKIRFKEGRDGAELGNIKLSCSKETKVPSSVQETGKLPMWLTDLDYLTSDRVSVRSEGTTTNTGEEYAHYINGQEGGSIEYYLKGEYNHLSAVWAISYNGRDTQINQVCEIYADDDLVYSSPSIVGGDMPVEVNVDIKYCQVLRIVFTEGNGYAELSNIYLEAK